MDDFDFDVLTGPSGPDCRACRPVKPPPAERTPAEAEGKSAPSSPVVARHEAPAYKPIA